MSNIPARKSRQGLVLAWGDSWLGFVPFVMNELRDCLVEWGYNVPEDYCRFGDWLMLDKMVQHRHAFKDGFLRKHLHQRPRAILLSGGGNDSVRDRLEELINPCAAGHELVHEDRLREHIRGLKAHYVTLIDEVQELDGQRTGIPFIVHGYDHPLPTHRGTPVWIRTPFWNRGYVDPAAPHDKTRCDLALAAQAMRRLIDALNGMLQELENERDNVHYVDLRGTIQALAPHDPASGWLDNMHPRAEGFRHMAARIAGCIESLPVTR